MKIPTTGIKSIAIVIILQKIALTKKSLFTQLIKALNSDDFATASSLQVENVR